MAQVTSQTEVVDDNGSRIAIPALHHTGNQTPRREEMLRWYRNVLGMQPMLEADPPAAPIPSVWASNDVAHHRMGFFAFPGLDMEKSKTSPGVNHTAWEYDTIDDLLETWERLKKLEIDPVFTVDHGVSFAFYYNDPDGNLIELLADAFADHEKSRELMLTSEEVKANPPGVAVDPAQLVEARKNGMSLEELHERAYAGEFSPENAPTHNVEPDQQSK